MEGLNRVTLLGNLGADPELRVTNGGQAVLNLSLATTRSYLDKSNERKEATDWHRAVVWGKRATALGKILQKGDRLYLEGRLQTSSYDDREGVKRYKTEVVVENVILTGGAKRASSAPNDSARSIDNDAAGAEPSYGDYDDIPF